VTWLPPYEQDVNTVFEPRAVPHLTIEDNVAFGLRREKIKSTRSVARHRHAPARRAD
jgi:ABC-type Fe3+/spermidine/putrescine transport system ATPase subunit